MMITCEKCGAKISFLEVDVFNYDGSDSCRDTTFEEFDVNAIVVDLDKNWTGYELSEEEMRETITCPSCHKWPFKSEEIQIYEFVRVVMFRQ